MEDSGQKIDLESDEPFSSRSREISDIYHLNAPLVHMQFDLKDYENRQFENKIQLATIGVLIAVIIFGRKFNQQPKSQKRSRENDQANQTKIDAKTLIAKERELIDRDYERVSMKRYSDEKKAGYFTHLCKFISPLPGLTLLWLLCAIHLLFELDLLKFTPQTSFLGAAGSGRTRRNLGEPEIPFGLSEDILQQEMPDRSELRTVTLRDISYSNSLVWWYTKFTSEFEQYWENRQQSVREYAKEYIPDRDTTEFVQWQMQRELLQKTFLDAKMPQWLNMVAPVLQSLLAASVVTMVVSLLFNFEEILGTTPNDAPVELDEEDEESSENENEEKEDDKDGSQKKNDKELEKRPKQDARLKKHQRGNKRNQRNSSKQVQNGNQLHLSQEQLRLQEQAIQSEAGKKDQDKLQEPLEQETLPEMARKFRDRILMFSIEYGTSSVSSLENMEPDYFYHMVIVTFLISLCGIKLVMWAYHSTLFIKFALPMRYIFFFLPRALTLDMTEQLAHSPRYLALFTTAVLRDSRVYYFYKDKEIECEQCKANSLNENPTSGAIKACVCCYENIGTKIQRTQYALIRILPFAIGLMHTVECMIRRQLVVNFNDIFFGVPFLFASLPLFIIDEFRTIIGLPNPVNRRMLKQKQTFLERCYEEEQQELEQEQENSSDNQEKKESKSESGTQKFQQDESAEVIDPSRPVPQFEPNPYTFDNLSKEDQEKLSTVIDNFHTFLNIKSPEEFEKLKKIHEDEKEKFKQEQDTKQPIQKTKENVTIKVVEETQKVKDLKQTNQNITFFPQNPAGTQKKEIITITLPMPYASNHHIGQASKSWAKSMSKVVEVAQTFRREEQAFQQVLVKEKVMESEIRNKNAIQLCDKNMQRKPNETNQATQKPVKQVQLNLKVTNSDKRPPKRDVPYDPNLVRPCTTFDSKTGQLKRNVEVHIINLSRLVQTIPGKKVFLHMPIIFEKTKHAPEETKLCQIYAWETQNSNPSNPSVKFEICEIDKKTGEPKSIQAEFTNM